MNLLLYYLEINLISNGLGKNLNSIFIEIESEIESLYFLYFRVVPKSEGEAIAAKFNCAFCETTAADDYEYVQQLFHRTVREVRKERERAAISNSISEEPTPAININTNVPSPSSSVSSNSSVHFSIPNETEKNASPSIIPLPPPIPATLAHKAAQVATSMKPDSQSSANPSLSSIGKSGSLPTVHSALSSSPSSATTTPASLPSTNSQSTGKRPAAKTSVFSKIFK